MRRKSYPIQMKNWLILQQKIAHTWN